MRGNPHGLNRGAGRNQLADYPEHACQQQTDHRTDDCDEELVCRAGGLSGNARDSPEDEQRDVVDAQPASASHQRMAELVYQHGAK